MDCSDTLKELINLTQRIKDTFDEAQQTASVIGDVLSKDIFNKLLLIKYLCSSIHIPYAPDSADQLKPLQTALSKILIQREYVVRQESRGFLGSLASVCFPDRTNEELVQAQLRIQGCYKSLQAKHVARIAILDRIDNKLDIRITNSEKNDVLAKELVQIGGVTSDIATQLQLLRYCEKFKKDSDVSALEMRYLKLKFNVLNNSMPQYLLGAPITEARGHSNGLVLKDCLVAESPEKEVKSIADGPNLNSNSRDLVMEAEESKDRIVELLRLSNDLRCGQEISPIKATTLIQRLIESIDRFRMLEEAADLSEWVVDILLGVVKSGDKAYKAPLVKSQVHYITRLIAAGRQSRAVNVARANVEMCQEEIGTAPKQWLPLLAEALRSQAVALHHAGSYDAEHTALVESINVHGQHAECDDGATSFHSIDYLQVPARLAIALALDNLSRRFSSLSRYIDAVDASNASLDIFQRLARTTSDDSLRNLAASYDALSSPLTAVKDYEGAITALQESTSIYLQLAKDQPATFLTEFARMSRKLSDRLTKQSRYQDALEALEDAIRLHQDLIPIPGPLRDLAACLILKSSTLCLLSRHEDALTAATESVSTYRKAFLTSPATTLVNLALSLDGLAWCLHKLGHHNAALSNLEEAFQLLSNSKYEVKPDHHKLIEKACLRTQASSLSQLGQYKEATQVEKKAAEIKLPLSSKDPIMDDLSLSFIQGLYKIDRSYPVNKPTDHPVPQNANTEDRDTLLQPRKITTGLKRSTIASFRTPMPSGAKTVIY
ncbi:hypothetical protein FRC02_002408 [Tulasnella sp. 418]|nr:hypothetical protein FRC02_002408 [Tulasnella sp. 418]